MFFGRKPPFLKPKSDRQIEAQESGPRPHRVCLGGQKSMRAEAGEETRTGNYAFQAMGRAERARQGGTVVPEEDSGPVAEDLECLCSIEGRTWASDADIGGLRRDVGGANLRGTADRVRVPGNGRSVPLARRGWRLRWPEIERMAAVANRFCPGGGDLVRFGKGMNRRRAARAWADERRGVPLGGEADGAIHATCFTRGRAVLCSHSRLEEEKEKLNERV
jgi:hypothetical protein